MLNKYITSLPDLACLSSSDLTKTINYQIMFTDLIKKKSF